MRILHVIESFGGGSAEAMRRFVGSTPDLEHHLLRALRPGEHADSDLSAEFRTVRELPRAMPAAQAAVREAVRVVEPEVIHAHSTFAGLFVRTAVRTTRRSRIVYTPHCFAFERLDVSRPTRLLYRAVEGLLARNTTVIAACSPREEALAAALPTRRAPILVPNTGAHSLAARQPDADRPLIAGMGRLGPQKDPREFARVARAVRRRDPRFAFLWIGDGDAGLRRVLEDAEVVVSGWLAPAQAVETLAGAAVYLHTAAWEGFPLAVLEAVQGRLPVVARRIPAFIGAPDGWLYDGPERGADLVLAAAGPSAPANIDEWSAATRSNTPAHQRAALLTAYGA